MSEDLSWIYLLHTIAVVGASRFQEKPAHIVPHYLKEKGFRIIPVNPSASEILGEKSCKTLGDIPGPVDVVLMFRPSEDISVFLPDILAVNPQVLWMQKGINHEPAKKEAEHHGIYVVMDKCMMMEHKKIFGD